MQRIGVFVCWCGSNIAATVDVERVSQALAKEPGVVFSTNYQYMCSQTGQQMIQEKIHEYGLTGVVICSCSPRMHEQTFRKTCEKAGLNPYMVEIANIREQCSWIHKDKEAGTEKAIILGRAAIAKVHLNAPLTAGSSPVTKRALVIGGGIAGIQTALDIAEAGFEVDIVEKQPTIGGKMTQIDKTFPTLDCAACILTPKMVDCAQNEKIHIYSYSEVESVGGFVGNLALYKATPDRHKLVTARRKKALAGAAADLAHGIDALIAIVRRVAAAGDALDLHGLMSDVPQRIVHALLFKAQLLGIAHVPQSAAAAAQIIFALGLCALG